MSSIPKTKPLILAQEFLDLEGRNFIAWNGDFYEYRENSGYYVSVPIEDLKARVMIFLQGQLNAEVEAITTQVKEVIANLSGLFFLPYSVSIGSWIKIPRNYESSMHFFNVKNGIVVLKMEGGKLKKTLIPHSPNYLIMGRTNYDFLPDAKCPEWENFILDVLPDPEKRAALQEWMGYNLIYNTEMTKSFILYGQGANGKTVVCVVMKTLIGKHNVSNVPLECMSIESNNFHLHSMLGKLANICEEIGEINREIDAGFKIISSGGDIQVNRKFRDPITMKSTARLTFATNTLPRFRDPSSAIPRRLIVIDFEKQILDESLQRHEFMDSNFWITQGEMSGVLNWALDGLERLLNNKKFTTPKSSKEALEQHFMDINPARSYLLEYFVATEDASELSPFDVYGTVEGGFPNYCFKRGYRPISLGNFTKEIKRTFPTVRQLKNPVLRNGVRVRPFIGLKFISPPHFLPAPLENENPFMKEHS